MGTTDQWCSLSIGQAAESETCMWSVVIWCVLPLKTYETNWFDNKR